MRTELRRIGLFWIAALALIATAVALEPPPDSDAFVGTWQAQFQGKTFFILKLSKQDGKLTGSVSHGNIEVDKNGELTKAEIQEGEDPIVDAKLTGKTLHLTSKDQEEQDTTESEMTLTGTDQAEIQMLGAGSPAPKPWPFTRVTSAAEEKPKDMQSKLATAAQIWLNGQFGAATTPGSGNAPSAVSANEASPSSSSASVSSKVAAPGTPLDSELAKYVDSLPRRVNDESNNLGDMVNFVLVGSEEQVQSALEAGKWFVADTNNTGAVLNAVLQTINKKDYMQMPMSKLMLFGRYQDYGYEQAEPIAMVASRHHFRLWKAPFQWHEQTVWVGAGTHDIGFERDQRNGKVTHKIDPAVDGERENIAGTFQKSAKTKNMTYYVPPNPVQEARNATGGSYHSDGRILVVFLQ